LIGTKSGEAEGLVEEGFEVHRACLDFHIRSVVPGTPIPPIYL
jgi:hypothetical protein